MYNMFFKDKKMKSRTLSRGPNIDMEVCVNNVLNNRFQLVLVAAERSREIKRQNKDSDKIEHVHPTVTALEEIQAGKIDPQEYLDKLRGRR